MDGSLNKTLIKLKAAAQEQRTTLESQLLEESVKRDEMLAQLARIKQEVDDQNEYLALLQEDLNQLIGQNAKKEQEETQKALWDCADNLISTATKVVRKNELTKYKQALVLENSDLLDELVIYRKFEQNPATILQILPKLLHQTVLDKMEELGAKLQPYLDIEAQEQSLVSQKEFYLEVAVIQSGAESVLKCLFPVPAELEIVEPEVKPFVETFKNLIINGITEANNDENRHIPILKNSVWKDLWLLELTGFNPNLEMTTFLQKRLTTILSPLFNEISLFVVVSQVSDLQFDSTGMDQISTATDNKGVKDSESGNSGVSLIGDSKNQKNLPKRATVKTVHASPGETTQISRDQTADLIKEVLVHLLGNGLVGPDTIYLSTLQEQFNPNQRIEFNKMMEALIQTNLLKNDTGKKRVLDIGLNAEHIPEVQNLFNRKITPFWETILTGLVSGKN